MDANPARSASPAGASLPRLVEIMDRLLAPDGCPWDREQTLDSLRPFLVEETYEVLDALSKNDPAGHCEELGDLLMQIVFQAALRARARAEDGGFDIDAVIAGISDKLVRRHPHVFGDVAGVQTSEQVLAQWEDIKRAEKAAAGAQKPRTLSGVKPAPALVRAQKIGSKAGKVGFDWPGWQGSLGKVEEETREVAEAAASGVARDMHHEIGDLLFAVVNVARKLGVDAETALIDATTRFQQRFEVVEDLLAERGKTPQSSSLEEMDALWNDAKRKLAEPASNTAQRPGQQK
ncbi:MAG TPA: nucleoside triphosphate pyrophosphohydrolase [Kofleriaceae bacterium]|nr:nucleoside triphosphate pyrophosphohydrolase [Kofleriaceae bacterium]